MTSSLMLPEPAAVAHVEPADAVHVQVTPTRDCGQRVGDQCIDDDRRPGVGDDDRVGLDLAPAAIEVRPVGLGDDEIRSRRHRRRVGRRVVAGGESRRRRREHRSSPCWRSRRSPRPPRLPSQRSVAVPPGSSETVVLIALPVRLTGHDDPTDAEHVHDTPTERGRGRRRRTAPSTTADGPALETTISVGDGVTGLGGEVVVGLGDRQVGLRCQRVDIGGGVVAGVRDRWSPAAPRRWRCSTACRSPWPQCRQSP